MTRPTPLRKRQRGGIDALPSGALRVRVYAGLDPLTRRRNYLTELIPAGPTAAREAEKARTRLLAQVDEKRSPRTKATLNQLLDRWLDVVDVQPSTRQGYVKKIDRHIRPVLGALPVARLDAETLERFYAVLRQCRLRCGGRGRFVEHRTAQPHECDERCVRHRCRPLAASTVRQLHWMLSGALGRAVRWRWLAVNPADQADKPALPHPDPRPPSSEEAARIVTAAWEADPDWGAFVWLAMTTGARRGELCGLRWDDVDLDAAVLTLRRSVYVDERGQVVEKDTKTHQQRRVALDAETVAVLRELRQRTREVARELEIDPSEDGHVFSYESDGSACWLPDTVTQRYGRLVRKLGVRTHLHALRHYSATELISAGVDVRTVAGRLGHGGGGATTLRVYAAWMSEADQRAAQALVARMPTRPGAVPRSPA
jgi:integrase